MQLLRLTVGSPIRTDYLLYISTISFQNQSITHFHPTRLPLVLPREPSEMPGSSIAIQASHSDKLNLTLLAPLPPDVRSSAYAQTARA